MSRARTRATAGRRLVSALCLVVTTLGSSPLFAESISAERALARAVQHSPALRAAAHDYAAAEQSVRARGMDRGPTFFAGASAEHTEHFSSTSQGATRASDQAVGSNAGIRYTTDVGTVLEFGIESQMTWRQTNIDPSTTDSVTIGPTYIADIYATARQPLLRGAGTGGVLAPLRQAEAERVAAEYERHEAASQLALDVLTAYWELWYADQAVAVEKQALDLATRQHHDAELKATELGTGAAVDVLRFESELSRIRTTLAQLRTTRTTRAVALGRLLGVDPVLAANLVATSAPPVVGPAGSEAQLVAAARRGSSELAAMRAQLDASKARLDAAEDADKPRLDIVSSVSAGGLWADDDLDGVALPGGRPALAVMIGFELETPLNSGAASAEHARAREQLAAAEARFEDRAEAIDAEVAALAIELESSAEQVALAEENAKLAARLAEAERQRLDLGQGVITDLIQAQQEQRVAELRELRAEVDRQTTALELEHRTGKLLERTAPLLGDGP